MVCKHTGMQSMPTLGRYGGMPPRKFWKNTLSEIESEGMFSDWSLFNAPMDTGTQNFLKCSYYLHAYIHAIIQLVVRKYI